jgi:hypothetical protein
MLFILTGSSGAGKTAVLGHLVGAVANLAVHDFDEVGIPNGADNRWRQQETEAWVTRAIRYHARSIDTLVAGQTPLGEWLAVPSVTRVNGVAACLLDVNPEVQTERLASRGRTPRDPALKDLTTWAAWHRTHAVDPQHEQGVLTENGWEGMRWERWDRWTSQHPCWTCSIFDTSHMPVEETAAKVRGWIDESRRLHARGELPLGGRWWDRASVGTPEASRSRT